MVQNETAAMSTERAAADWVFQEILLQCETASSVGCSLLLLGKAAEQWVYLE